MVVINCVSYRIGVAHVGAILESLLISVCVKLQMKKALAPTVVRAFQISQSFSCRLFSKNLNILSYVGSKTRCHVVVK